MNSYTFLKIIYRETGSYRLSDLYFFEGNYRCPILIIQDCYPLYCFIPVMAYWAECSPIARENEVQPQFESYERLKK